MSNAQKPLGYIVTLETSNFRFEAHGITEEQANEAMGRMLTRHCKQTGADPDFWAEDDFQTQPFMPGEAWRDGQPMI